MARGLVRNGERKLSSGPIEKPKLDVLISLIQKTWKFKEKRADNAGIASGSSHALQGSKPWARRSLWRKQTQYSQVKACMHRRSSRIYDKAFGENCNNLAEREAEITNLPWTQTEKDNALGRCRSGQRAWRNKKTCARSLSAVTHEEGHPLENEDESGRRLCVYW